MSEIRDFEREVAAWVDSQRDSAPPIRALDEVLIATSRQRPLPRWLALIKEPPMRLSSRVSVGSPAARLTAILAATILFALVGAGAVVAGASYLAGSGPLIVDPNDPSSYQSITAAVEAAEDGDTILVRPGIYPESVIITEDITLRGEGSRDDVVIEISAGGPTFPTEFGPMFYGLMIEGSDAEVSDLTVRAMAGADPTQYSGLVVDGGAPRIHDLTTADGVNSAVWFMGGSSATVIDSILGGIVFIMDRSSATLERNTIKWHVGVFNAGAAEPATVRENDAIGVTIDGPALVEDNTIRLDGTFWSSMALTELSSDEPNSEFAGIDARSSDGWIVRGNDVSGFITAIDVRIGSSGLIEDNDLTANTAGIVVRGGDSQVVRNTVGGGETGIEVGFGSSTLIGNTVEGAGVGIRVGPGSRPTLSDNVLCGNGVNLSIAEGAEPVLETNEICPDGLVTATE